LGKSQHTQGSELIAIAGQFAEFDRITEFTAVWDMPSGIAMTSAPRSLSIHKDWPGSDGIYAQNRLMSLSLRFQTAGAFGTWANLPVITNASLVSCPHKPERITMLR
jgi:hypothetical protein